MFFLQQKSNYLFFKRDNGSIKKREKKQILKLFKKSDERKSVNQNNYYGLLKIFINEFQCYDNNNSIWQKKRMNDKDKRKNHGFQKDTKKRITTFKEEFLKFTLFPLTKS